MSQGLEAAKITSWIEREIGGTVERCERQMRWRPGWFVDLRRDGTLLELYVRGDRNEEFPPWPLEYERDVLTLLANGPVPVPKVYGFCPDPRAIVLERVAGRPNLATAASEDERRTVLDELARHMASMHALDVTPFLAAGLRKPVSAEERAIPFFLEGEKLYLRYKGAPDPRLEFVRRWVHRHLPQDREELCFAHGDPGQFVFENGHITAMLDFEWACLGDPMMDLGGLRLRALHEPMGDIAPLFQRYVALTGRAIDRDVLGFHTVAFIANTALAISPALAHPKAGVDYPEYVNWYVVSLLFALTSIAEVKGIAIEEPALPVRSQASRWSPVFDVMAETFGSGAEDAGSSAPDAYDRSLSLRLTRFARKLESHGAGLEDAYVRDVAELIGQPVDGWQDADRRLEQFVLDAGTEMDETLLRLFHRWCWRQIGLLDGVVDNEMWKLKLQPLSELV